MNLYNSFCIRWNVVHIRSNLVECFGWLKYTHIIVFEILTGPDECIFRYRNNFDAEMKDNLTITFLFLGNEIEKDALEKYINLI